MHPIFVDFKLAVLDRFKQYTNSHQSSRLFYTADTIVVLSKSTPPFLPPQERIPEKKRLDPLEQKCKCQNIMFCYHMTLEATENNLEAFFNYNSMIHFTDRAYIRRMRHDIEKGLKNMVDRLKIKEAHNDWVAPKITQGDFEQTIRNPRITQSCQVGYVKAREIFATPNVF